MSGELISIRMLVVASSQAATELWRQGAARVAVPVEIMAADPISAGAALAGGAIDICIVDGGLADADKLALVNSARRARPAPLVLVSGSYAEARVDGADGLLGRPTNADEARRLTETCIRAKLPMRVLIVDDSGTTRSIVRKMLSASRFALDVHEASEGISALEQLRTGGFGLVFLDYNMPGFNGLETLSEIKRETPNVSVVMMTSTLDPAIAIRAQAAGALAFLKKPFFPADIHTVFQRYFGLHAPR